METVQTPPHLTSQCMSVLHNVDDALYVIGGKWKLRIIVALADGPLRFNELQRTITGISSRVLSNELKDLEQNGFVDRTVDHATSPVSVMYARTTYSESLRDVIGALASWGAIHRRKLMQR